MLKTSIRSKAKSVEASHSFASVTVLVFAGEDTSSHPNGGGGCHDGLGEVPRQNRGGAN